MVTESHHLFLLAKLENTIVLVVCTVNLVKALVTHNNIVGKPETPNSVATLVNLVQSTRPTRMLVLWRACAT
jgi:hypothetical protein